MSYLFDGVNDSIHWGDIPDIDDATVLTCSAWIWQNNITQDHHIVGTRNVDTGFMIFFDDVGAVSGRTDVIAVFVKEFTGGTTVRIESATSAGKANVWQHVLFTFEANINLRLWINGIEDANSPVSASGCDNMGNTNLNVIAGENNAGTADRNGRLAEIAFWKRLLTEREIKKLAAGYAPNWFPRDLAHYADLRRNPRDAARGRKATIAGAVQSALHPRIIYPSRKIIIAKPPTAGGATILPQMLENGLFVGSGGMAA